MRNLLSDLTFDHPAEVLLALIPALLNAGILAYAFFFLPRNRISYTFALFVLSLTVWQLSDALVRMSGSAESAAAWTRLLMLGALLIAPAGLHFTLLFTGKNKTADSLPVLFLIYFPAFLFEALLAAGIYEVNVRPSGRWNWLPVENALMLAEAAWVAALALLILALLFVHAHHMRMLPEKKYQTLLIACGFAVPTVQGIVTQVIFPAMGKPPVPLASTFMTAFSVSAIIALARYKLFRVSIKVASQVVVNTITDILVIVGPDGMLRFLNPAGEKALGIQKDELEKHSVADLFASKADFENFKNNVWDRIQAGEKVEGYITSLQAAGKKSIPVFISANSIPGKDRAKAMLIIAHDMTTRKKAEDSLREQTQLYESLLRAQSEMGEGVAITEGERFIYVNDALCHIYGYSKEELMALPSFLDLVIPEQREVLTQRLRDRLSNPKDLSDYGETSVRHKEGHVIHIAYSLRMAEMNGRRQIFSIIRDITGQKQIEKSLLNQARIMKSIIDQMAEGLVISDDKNNFILVNAFAEKILGLHGGAMEKRNDKYGSFLSDKITRLSIEKFPTVRALRGEETTDMEVFIRNQNFPEGIFISMNGMPIKDEGKKIIGSIVTFRDITERKKHEEKIAQLNASLSESKTQLLTAQQIAHIGSWEWDIVKNTVTWSDELYRIYGMQPRKASLTYEELLHPVHIADRGMAKKVIEESFRTCKPFNFYYRIVRPDSSIRNIHAIGQVSVNQEGKAVKMFGTVQDVTDRVREEELEKLAAAATQSYNSVVIADRDGRIEWVNEGFTKLTGYTLNEVKDTHGELLRKGEETGLSSATRHYETVIKEKSAVTYESKNFAKDGREYWVITTLTPVLGKDGEVERIIAIDSDITLRKHIEEDLLNANKIAEHSLMKGNKALDELMKAKRELEESMKVKEQFLANMSHEIRTPMNAIVGFTELLIKTPLSPEQRQYIEAIKTSGENLLVIINDILDFSKIESGKIVLEEIPFQLSQVIYTLTDLMLPKSTEKNIKLSAVIDKRIQDDLLGDPTRLNQILLNLVGNAIKFTDKGEVKISVDLEEDNPGSVGLKFTVSDTGIGIPEKKLNKIFDAFTQASSETTRKYGGTGLGLAIVRQLIELQGGSITVSSQPGNGSSFTFRLKFRKNMEAKERKERPVVKEENTERIEGLNVLLVEDNVLNQVLAKKVLNDWKWNVEVAENGLVAIQKLEQQDFDIVLMDIQLPEMDGYEATRHIRHAMKPPKCHVPIMAMTAHAISSEEEKCLRAGMNGYISKPFNQKALYEKIVSVVKGKGTVQVSGNGHEKNTTAKGRHTDLTYLRELSNGSNKFIAEMITLFLEQTPDALSKMEKSVREKDWKTLRAIAHKIKPSIIFIGLKEIEKDIHDLEDFAAEEKNLDQVPPLIDKIRQVCSVALEELRADLSEFA
ncbi:MAG: PAS domain S-box protein [Bacteroidota bacterium]